MQYVDFTDGDKIDCFDEIAKHFYEHNFGQFSKADMELLMFRFYMKKMIDSNKNEDNTIDYSKCSDYKISKDLGITQQRVRNLKVKNQLAEPIEFNWEKSVVQLLENARFDKESRKVTMNIPDPNLYIEIENFIEENGGYIEKQLNRKMLQIRAEYFLALTIAAEVSNESRANIIKRLRHDFEIANKDNMVFDEKDIGKSIKDAVETGKDIVEIAKDVEKLLSPGNILGDALATLVKKMTA